MSWTTQPIEAARLAESLSREALAAGDAVASARALQVLAWCRQINGDSMRALEIAAGARRLWLALGDAGEAARAGATMSQCMTYAGMTDDALTVALAAAEEAAAAGAGDVSLLALNARAMALVNGGELEEAVRLFQQLAADAADDRIYGAIAANNLCHTYLEQYARASAPDPEVLDRALAQGLESIELASAMDFSWCLRGALDNTARVLAERGAFADAERMLVQSAAVPGEPGLFMEMSREIARAEVAFRKGDYAAARLFLLALRGRALDNLDSDTAIRAGLRLAEACAALGDFAAAYDAYRLYHDHFIARAGNEARWRGRVTEIMLEADHLRAEARRLAEDVVHDPLTGLANRRGLEARRAALEAGPYAVALFDLDHFKRVNDDFSHAVGDAVLRQVAALVRPGPASTTFAVRLGGEEFALVAPGLDELAMLALAERLRARIAAHDWSAIAEGLAITASFGVAATRGAPLAASLAAADRALYEAKGRGRNVVVADSSLPLARSA